MADPLLCAAQVRPLQSSLLKHCFVSKQPVVCNSTRTEPRYFHDIDGLLPDVKVASTLLVPLITDSGATIGVLQVSVCQHLESCVMYRCQRVQATFYIYA